MDCSTRIAASSLPTVLPTVSQLLACVHFPTKAFQLPSFTGATLPCGTKTSKIPRGYVEDAPDDEPSCLAEYLNLRKLASFRLKVTHPKIVER